MFEGRIATIHTVCFESVALRKKVLGERKEGDKLTEAQKIELDKRRLIVELDFSDVTEEEIFNLFLASTTSPVKMLQNNELKNWTDDEVQEQVLKGAYRVRVRDLIDGRQTKKLSPEQKMKRRLKELLEAGLSKEQIMAQIDALQAE